MKKLDKKQVPQVMILAIVSLALFGYFAKTMLMPGPASAKTATPATVAPAAAVQAAAPTADGASASLAVVSAPTGGMRDPFTQAALSKAAPTVPATDPPAAPLPAVAPRLASLRALPPAAVIVPSAPPLPALQGSRASRPGMASLPPLPVAPPWTVTGVLQSGEDQLVILRSGEARRIVKQGDFVDGQFRVASVTRNAVVLRSGNAVYTLPLGGTATRSAPSTITASFVSPVKKVPVSAPALSQVGRSMSGAPASAIRIARLLPASRTLPAPRFVPAPRRILTPLPRVTTAALLRPVPASPVQFKARVNAPVPRRVLTVAVKAPAPRPIRHFVAAVRTTKANIEQFIPMAGVPPAGTLAPEFSLPTLSGPRVALSDLHGRVVVLNFWASWIAGSLPELAELRTMQAKLGSKGLTVLNINSWDRPDAASALLARLPARGAPRLYDQLYDPSVSNDSVAVSLYHAPDVPALYVIDQNGAIAATFVGYGPRTTASLKATLKSLGVF